MAIYKPPPSRWRLALATGIAGLIIGLGVGAFLLGQSDPNPTEVIGSVRTELSGVAGVLEVLEVEYTESVRDGDVVSETEYDGAVAALTRAQARFAEARPTLLALDREKVQDIDGQFDELRELIADHASADEVSEAIRELTSALDDLP